MQQVLPITPTKSKSCHNTKTTKKSHKPPKTPPKKPSNQLFSTYCTHLLSSQTPIIKDHHHVLVHIYHLWMHVLPAGLSPRYWSHRRRLGWIPFRGRTAVNGPVFWLATASTDVIALIAETHVWRWRQAAVDVAGGDGGSFSVADAEVAAICKRLP